MIAGTNRKDKLLMVEGKRDKLVICEFLELSGISWPSHRPPVNIIDAVGKCNIPKITKETLKSDDWESVGIIVDADDDAEAAWSSFRNTCTNIFTDIPNVLPREGYWIGSCETKKVGIWIMPGHMRSGMIEDFLVQSMKNDESISNLWDFARISTKDALNNGATYKSVHMTKAQVHCWLAWQDPGDQLHQNMRNRFDPGSGHGPDFKQWFCNLFGL